MVFANLLRTFFFLALVFGLQGCEERQTSPFNPDGQEQKLVIDVEDRPSVALSLNQLFSSGKLTTMAYRGSLHGEERQYEGLELEHLLNLAAVNENYTILKVHCRDGYESEVPLSTLRRGRFLLAVRDVGAAPSAFLPYEEMIYLQKKTPELTQRLEKETLSQDEREKLTKERDHARTLSKDLAELGNQGPFYPIFLPDESLPKEEDWSPPFCVDRLTFKKEATDLTAALPHGLPEDHPAVRGSSLFQSRCSSCHSVNGIGGLVGPELNRPLSVTEYWTEAGLRQMMKDPSQVRENSKMPAFHLKDPMIDDILAYLRWMREHKKLD
jgi:mono/diheme cytochrome c family protein